MGKVSAKLNAAIEGFLDNASSMSNHIGERNNPHAVTKEQVGLGNVKNEEQATKAELTAHTGAQNNPHSVTKTQVGLSNVTNDKQATEAAFLAHSGNTGNPHGVTKVQVGLGNVQNAEQATKAEYTAHVAGTADRHSATGITYDATYNLKQYLDQLALESGSGTMDHSLLVNKDLPNAHPISAISGVGDRYGYIYIFKGVTADLTETELFTDETGPHISEDGRLKVAVGQCLMLDFDVIARRNASGTQTPFSYGIRKHSGALVRTTGNNVSYRLSNSIVDMNASGLIGDFKLFSIDAEGSNADGFLNIKVTSGMDAEAFWKVVVRVIPMNMEEF